MSEKLKKRIRKSTSTVEVMSEKTERIMPELIGFFLERSNSATRDS